MNEDRRRIKFDPTVNLGHILTFVGFIAAGFGAYGLIDKRVTVLEVQVVRSMQDNTAQKEEMRQASRELREDIKEVRKSMDDLVRSVRGVDRQDRR